MKNFQVTKTEKIYCWQICIIKNIKGSSSDQWKTISDGSVDL